MNSVQIRCRSLVPVGLTGWNSRFFTGAGAGNTVSAVLRGLANQVLTPDEYRGRVSAVNSVFVMGGPQLGQFESGAVASLVSTQFSAVTGGIGALALTGLVALLPRVRRFNLPADSKVVT